MVAVEVSATNRTIQRVISSGKDGRALAAVISAGPFQEMIKSHFRDVVRKKRHAPNKDNVLSIVTALYSELRRCASCGVLNGVLSS